MNGTPLPQALATCQECHEHAMDFGGCLTVVPLSGVRHWRPTYAVLSSERKKGIVPGTWCGAEFLLTVGDG